MPATDRLRHEQQFHDQQAAERRRWFAKHPEQLLVDDEAYLNHESWIRPAFTQLGCVQGKTVLDYGCGHGMASVLLARRGASVAAFDLSPWYLAEAAERARANDVGGRVHFVHAAAEALPFANHAFDCVWGNAILHHLDLERALPELRRVLKPGGTAVFCEPWGGNPVLEWARRWLPYPGKARSLDERPLRPRQLERIRCHFPSLRVQGYQLAAMVGRLWPGAPLLADLDRLDAAFLKRWPGLGRYCRYVVLTLCA